MATRTYGLHDFLIRSRIELPELREESREERKPVVQIDFGQTPDTIPHIGVGHEGYLVGLSEALISIANVARYHVIGGHTIWVQPVNDGVDPGLVRFYLLGPAMTALLFQRGAFPLHAGAVEIDRHACAFLGFSGAGKSTLTATFAVAGYHILTDDRLVLRETPFGLMAEPGVPVLNLTVESAEAIGVPADTIIRDTLNFGKKMHNSTRSCSRGLVPLGAMFFLDWSADNKIPLLTRLNPFDALTLLREHVNYEGFLRILMLEESFLRSAASLVADVPFFRLERPRDFRCLSATAAIVKDALAQERLDLQEL